MTDQTLDDQLRPIVAAMRVAMRRDENTYSYAQFLDDMSGYIKELEALLPSRPTLADMTWEERRAHIGATAELCGELVIISDMDADHVRVITEGFNPQWPELTSVTPRPDLPRFTWPGDTPVSLNTLAVGDVIDSADDPRLDALPAGSILSDCDGENVAKRAEAWVGIGYIPIASERDEFGPWTVLHIPNEADQ